MRKTIISVLILIIIVLSSLCSVFAEYGIIAQRTSPSLYLNGEQIYCTGFNVDGYNYFRLRDLAKALKGTSSQFDVIWNSKEGQVEIITGRSYIAEESVSGYYQDSYVAYPTASPVLIDGKIADIKAYNINGYNYFRLRDLAGIIPFYVDWSEAQNSIYITTQLSEGAYKAETGYQLQKNAISAQFDLWPGIQNSYITKNDDGTISVIDIDDHVKIETYDMNYKLVDSKSIDFELPVFGAFYSGDKFNYIAYGQENPKQYNNKEVIRIVKYDKDFTRIGSLSVHGGESFTVTPFTASGGRMAEKGNKLVFHTSRTRYKTSDGINHQSQLTIIVNTASMEVLNNLGEYQPNHVSHSFNQFVIFDGESHVLLDHGDAYPRSVVLHKQAGENAYTEVPLFKISGATGANYTGVSIGGFEMSSQNYIAAINSIDQSKSGKYTNFGKVGMDIDERDVILCIVPKDKLNSTSVKQIKLTKYLGTGKYASTPKLVKINENKFMVLWQEIIIKKGSNMDFSCGDMKYLTIDGSGNAIGKIRTLSGDMLSACAPVLMENQIVWYVNQRANRIFYTAPIE